MSKKLYRVPEAVEQLYDGAMSCWTLYDLIKCGRHGCVRVGRKVFVTSDHVAEFIAGGGTRADEGAA